MGKAPTVEEGGTEEKHENKVKKEKDNPQNTMVMTCWEWRFLKTEMLFLIDSLEIARSEQMPESFNSIH